jgi:hypothetical protein
LTEAQDLQTVLMTAAVQIDEHGNAIDEQSSTTYVILLVIENGNAVDVYNVKPIFRASDDVWHVSPRLDYLHIIQRLTDWEITEREDYWQQEQRLDYWKISLRLNYWRLYE